MTAHFVHPSSFVDPGAQIGEGTRIWHFSHVLSGARIGRNCILGQNVNVDRDVVVGDGVKVQNNVSIYKGVYVEDGVFLGPSCVFTNVINPRAFIERKAEFRETRVGRGASVGANATIVCGHDIGRYALIGAGAVVTRSVPDHAIVTGVPGRVTGWVCRCGERLPLGVGLPEGPIPPCSACGERYVRAAEGLALEVPRGSP